MTKLVTLRPFGALADFRNGINFSAFSRGIGDLSVIGVGDFQENERIANFEHLERIARPRSLDEGALLRDGDLVFVRSNGSPELVGRCLLVSDIRGPVSHSGFTIRARLTSTEVSPEWIGQFFAVGLARRTIRRRGGGTNISNLSQQVLQQLLVPVPEPHYQARVLGVAKELSAILRLLEAERVAKQRRKRGLLALLLNGRKRFQEFSGRPWPVRRFGQICEELTDRNRNGLGPESVMGVVKGIGFVPMRERVRGKGDLAKYKVVPPEAFAYNPMRLNIGSIAHNDSGKSVLVSPDYVVFRARPGVSEPSYVDQLRWSPHWTSFMDSAGAGSVRVRIYFSDLMRLQVPAPASDEQSRIADVLRLLDRELDQLRKLHDLTLLQRREVLTRLFSGERTGQR